MKSSLAPVKPWTQEQRPPAGARLGERERDRAAEAGDLDGALDHDAASAEAAEAAQDLGEGRDLVGRRDLDVDRLAVVEELDRHRHRGVLAGRGAPKAPPMSMLHAARQAVAVDPDVDRDLGVVEVAELLERGLDLAPAAPPGTSSRASARLMVAR